ncbi:MAG: nucleotidyltransferase domain-containing protein [Spirosomataceae bacterium]
MNGKPVFPTVFHRDAAEVVRNYFGVLPEVDTVLVVNSCARGQAVPESDLDFAILVKPETTKATIQKMENAWQNYMESQPTLLKYRQLTQFSHLHLDIIQGIYTPTILEVGVATDFFEIEIGNQICYSAPMDTAGRYFQELQKRYLPYYEENLRKQRLTMTWNACEYDLNHIPFFVKRGLYFQAFDILYKAFQEYLQTLFIANKTYPIAYNKWIKEQIVNRLRKPELYLKLPPVLSVTNIESSEVNEKAKMLRDLLEDIPQS